MGQDEHPPHRPSVSILFPLQSPGEVDLEMVERVVHALYEDPSMLEVLAARPDPDAPAYTTLSELKGLPPAGGVPFLIPEIGVLSIPAPVGGALAVEKLLRDIAPGAQVREAGTYSAQEDAPPTVEQ